MPAKNQAYFEQRGELRYVGARAKDKIVIKPALWLLVINGWAGSITAWAKHSGVQRKTIYQRLRYGYTPAQAVSHEVKFNYGKPDHGTRNRYAAGCRCNLCKHANNLYHRNLGKKTKPSS